MKKIFSLLLFAGIATVGFSQTVITFGVKYGILHPDNINRTVYTYNYTRQWLDQKMDFFKMMHGYEFTWQHRGEAAGLEFSFARIGQKNDAHGLEPSSGLNGYRRIKLSTGGLSFGLTAYLMKRDHMEIVPALDFDLIFFTSHTWYSNDPGFAGAEEASVINQFKMGNTLALNWTLFATSWLGVNIRPYYQLPWGKANVEGLMDYLQGAGDPMRERLRNYGVSVSLAIGLHRD